MKHCCCCKMWTFVKIFLFKYISSLLAYVNRNHLKKNFLILFCTHSYDVRSTDIWCRKKKEINKLLKNNLLVIFYVYPSGHNHLEKITGKKKDKRKKSEIFFMRNKKKKNVHWHVDRLIIEQQQQQQQTATNNKERINIQILIYL